MEGPASACRSHNGTVTKPPPLFNGKERDIKVLRFQEVYCSLSSQALFLFSTFPCHLQHSTSLISCIATKADWVSYKPPPPPPPHPTTTTTTCCSVMNLKSVLPGARMTQSPRRQCWGKDTSGMKYNSLALNATAWAAILETKGKKLATIASSMPQFVGNLSPHSTTLTSRSVSV